MQNGYRHETGNYSPETAVGTGALEPLVDEYEAATAVPTVDEKTLDESGKRSRNKPRPGEDEVNYSGDKVAEPTSDEKSTGEDAEVRSGENLNVSPDDAEVNQPADEVRPEAPQQTKRARKDQKTV